MGLKRIKLSEIVRNPEQPRQHFDKQALIELAASIRENGLQQPIVVRPIKSNLSGFPEGVKYMIVLGERRYRAHQLLDEKGQLEDGAILANIREMTDEEMHIVAIVENLARVDVSPLEEARAFKRLLDSGMSRDELARRIGISQPFRVSERVALLNLDEDIQKLMEKNQIPAATAQELARLEKSDQRRVLQLIQRGDLTTWTQIRSAVVTILDKKSQEDIFGETLAVSQKDVEMLTQMERRIESVARMVSGGWKDNECIIARKVSPDRAALMVAKLKELRKSLGVMERDLETVSAQAMLAA